MDGIPESYSVETIEQLRGVADPLRIRIFEALTQRAMTATQVGEELGLPAPKAHYHVRELERLGLVKLVETRERGGILEKYYRAVARNLIAPSQLLQSAEPNEVVAAINEIFSNLGQSLLTAMSHLANATSEEVSNALVGVDGITVWMTPEEGRQALKSVEDTFEPFRARRGIPGEREVRFTTVTFDTQLASPDEGETPKQGKAASVQATPRQRVRPVWVVGMVVYTRSELEEVVAAGEQLDINVTGYLSFSDNVSPDLVNRAVARLHYRGVINAKADVREALRSKEH